MDFFTIFDADGVILYVASAIGSLLGYDPASLIGKDGYSLVHKEDLPKLKMACCDGGWQGSIIGAIGVRLLHQDGSWHAMKIRCIPLVGRSGVTAVLLGVSADASQSDTSAGLEQERLLTAIDRVVTEIIHDVRNPLSAIEQAAFLLKNMASEEPDATKYIQWVEKGTQNTLSTLHNIHRNLLHYTLQAIQKEPA